MPKITGRIDIHHHALPPPYLAALNNSGRPQLAGVDPVTWSVESDLEVMDRNGIEVAILSVTAPGATLVAGPDAERLCRQTNESGCAFREVVASASGSKKSGYSRC